MSRTEFADPSRAASFAEAVQAADQVGLAFRVRVARSYEPALAAIRRSTISQADKDRLTSEIEHWRQLDFWTARGEHRVREGHAILNWAHAYPARSLDLSSLSGLRSVAATIREQDPLVAELIDGVQDALSAREFKETILVPTQLWGDLLTGKVDAVVAQLSLAGLAERRGVLAEASEDLPTVARDLIAHLRKIHADGALVSTQTESPDWIRVSAASITRIPVEKTGVAFMSYDYSTSAPRAGVLKRAPRLYFSERARAHGDMARAVESLRFTSSEVLIDLPIGGDATTAVSDAAKVENQAFVQNLLRQADGQFALNHLRPSVGKTIAQQVQETLSSDGRLAQSDSLRVLALHNEGDYFAFSDGSRLSVADVRTLVSAIKRPIFIFTCPSSGKLPFTPADLGRFVALLRQRTPARAGISLGDAIACVVDGTATPPPSSSGNQSPPVVSGTGAPHPPASGPPGGGGSPPPDGPPPDGGPKQVWAEYHEPTALGVLLCLRIVLTLDDDDEDKSEGEGERR